MAKDPQTPTHYRLVVGVDPKTPDGRSKAFRNGAGECLQGAMILDAKFKDQTPSYILTFHALELALKAFLAKNGLTNDQLRTKPYGHDLHSLYGEACKHGLSISILNVAVTIEWINEYHDKGALLRYDFENPRALPMCETLFPIVEAILVATK
jgi:hypothetical protein